MKQKLPVLIPLLSSLACFSLVKFFFSSLFIEEHAGMAGEDRNGWKIHWPNRLVSFCCEGVIPTLLPSV